MYHYHQHKPGGWNRHIEPQIEILENAVVCPSTSPFYNDIGIFVQESTVFKSDGEVCELSLHLAGDLGFDNIPGPYPGDIDQSVRVGTHFYGGVLIGHFGHFLFESLARLWGVDQLNTELQSIVFVKGWGLMGPDGQGALMVPHFVDEALRLLSLGGERTVIHQKPVRYQRLVVASQLYGSRLLRGHPYFHQFVHRLKGVKPVNQVKDDCSGVYISRRKLLGGGGLLCEAVLEENLRRYGYTIIYPEELTIEQQVSIYNTNRRLIFAEGSALHLFCFVATEQHDVVVIDRRVQGIPHVIDQIISFGAPKIHEINCVIGHMFRNDSDMEHGDVLAMAMLDFNLLGASLAARGFIPDQDQWRTPTAEELAFARAALMGEE